MTENEEKIVLLQAWADLIKKDIENLSGDREVKFKEYKKFKEQYDKRIAARLKIVTKVDKFINDRRKALVEVENEMKTLAEPAINIVVVPEEPTTGSAKITQSLV